MSESPTGVKELRELVGLVRRSTGFDRVLERLQAGQGAEIEGTWGSAAPVATVAVARDCPTTTLVILPREKDVDEFSADLASFGGAIPLVLPAWNSVPDELSITDPILGSRLRVLRELEAPLPPRLVVTTIHALLQPVPSRESRETATRRLRTGTELDLEGFTAWLIAHGFERMTAIEQPGEFCLHGGILDIFPVDSTDPVRVELFGDEIDSLRLFDVESQQKLKSLDEIAITVVKPAADQAGGESAGVQFVDALPTESWVVLLQLPEVIEEAKQYLDRLGDRRGLFSVESVLERCQRRPLLQMSSLSLSAYDIHCRLRTESLERLSGPRGEALKELSELVQRDEKVLIACHNEGARERLQELLTEHDATLGRKVQLCVGTVTRGFRLADERLIVLSDNELFGRTEVRRAPRKKRIESRAIDSFLDLAEGDLVVHLAHGIARFRGMQILEKEGQKEEHLHLEFKENLKLYVPVSLIHLVQKYIGGAKTAPELSKLGGNSWAKKKQKVAEAVTDLAADMLQLQAERAAKPGIACPPDSHWQQEFDASFPYTETDDQLRAIADLKEDMERSRPMDRLICGDVGYGKTEVAMRAAFKAVDAGRQVAILVPTTVLAEQHYRSFSERMAEFPVTIACLSRFKTRSEQKEILERLAEGGIDIVIGTHRIVQADIRFKDLGLLVIDEEQRFGVEAKEMLKRLKLEVDVLTLSATPIPRTLHLSLMGIRDISSLETPPQDRVAVETRVTRYDTHLIRQAIVREMNRDGQIYFVHNRVYNIESIADRIRAAVPEATVDIVHGQMTEHELERAMLGFVSRRTDVLVATTIIESGLDIPNANTIFINQADQYGLADLHQLRGRVGRYKHRAYCYLLLDEGKTLTPLASRRLKAIEEFSELGAGFKIAMRDLEIRGAGNILGTEQSGHIASVGYELYCQLLENAVRLMKREPLRENRHVAVDLPLSAYLPVNYVPPGRPKIEMYRKLSSITSLEQLEQMREELRDRFGPIPEEAEKLLQLRELQVLAQYWQIDDIHLEEGYGVLGYRNPRKIQKLAKMSPHPLRIVDDRNAFLVLPHRLNNVDSLLAVFKSVLQCR